MTPRKDAERAANAILQDSLVTVIGDLGVANEAVLDGAGWSRSKLEDFGYGAPSRRRRALIEPSSAVEADDG